jgi:putative DNA primase/helicase
MTARAESPEQLLARHGIRLSRYAPGRYYARCPDCSRLRSTAAHRNAQCLGVTIEGDSARWGCNHCGWTGPKKGNGADGPPLTAYIYRNADGLIRFRKVRNAPGREPRFWLQKWDGAGGWQKGTKGVDTSLVYRADEVREAIDQGREIACVEGEKDADRLWSLDVPATCNAHGASETGKAPKWTKAHSEQLRGAPIVVLNDNDSAGYAHAEATCRLSVGVAKRIRRLDLAPHWPMIGKGDDVSDWLDRGGGSAEALRALIAGAPDYTPRAGDGEAHRPNGGPADAEIARLAALSPLAYEQARKMAAEKLNVRATALDRLVKAARGQSGPDGGAKQGHALDLAEPEPWPEPVDGTRLLDDITAEITRYVVVAEHAASATALWCVHTHLLDNFLISPRLAIRSPVMRCGKTTLLDVVARLTLRALPSANVTPAAVFRVVEACRPTLLIDEADTFLPGNEELRGVVNSGHRKGGKVIRTVGEDHEPRTFSTYSAVAIALIGKLPATLHDRSAPVVDLKRRLRSEKVESFRLDRVAALDDLASKAARWAFDNAAQVQGADPKLPDGLFNRDADNWRPLLAIAEAAGRHWPERARKAAVLCCEIDEDDVSQIEALLADIRDVFAEKKPDDVSSQDEITSAALIARLVGMESHPWAEMGKNRKALTQNKLARTLKPLGIGPGMIGPEDKRGRGYRLGQFAEAFNRYLPAGNGFQTVHPYSFQQKQGITSKSKVYSADLLDSLKPPASGWDSEKMYGCTVGNEGNGDATRVCAHCGKFDGREELCALGDETLWLHPEC